VKLLHAIACVAACDRKPPIRSCADDLTGEYGSGDRHWMVLDRGTSLEAYPLFPDVPAGEIEIAPRIMELDRVGAQVSGEVRRRYMKGSAACIAKVPVRVTTCSSDGLELVFAETSPPLSFTPCQWPRPESSRLERWQRR
jgi:hypothetical protein